MISGNLFMIVWCSLVGLMAVVNFAWAINDLKKGSARLSWYSARVDRFEEPFEYWLAVGGKFLGVVVAGFMFWLGSGMLKW